MRRHHVLPTGTRAARPKNLWFHPLGTARARPEPIQTCRMRQFRFRAQRVRCSHSRQPGASPHKQLPARIHSGDKSSRAKFLLSFMRNERHMLLSPSDCAGSPLGYSSVLERQTRRIVRRLFCYLYIVRMGLANRSGAYANESAVLLEFLDISRPAIAHARSQSAD